MNKLKDVGDYEEFPIKSKKKLFSMSSKKPDIKTVKELKNQVDELIEKWDEGIKNVLIDLDVDENIAKEEVDNKKNLKNALRKEANELLLEINKAIQYTTIKDDKPKLRELKKNILDKFTFLKETNTNIGIVFVIFLILGVIVFSIFTFLYILSIIIAFAYVARIERKRILLTGNYSKTNLIFRPLLSILNFL